MAYQEIDGSIAGNTAVNKWRPAAVALPIALITFALFTPILHNGFILWDDNGYIYQNDTLGQPLSESIPYFFGAHFFIDNYHPLTMLLYSLLHRIAGNEPAVFHAASLFFHVLNVLLVFSFTWLLSGRKLIVAAVTSLFFGIHPMHVESVAWAAELKDVLYTSFFLAGLISYLKYLKPEDRSHADRRVSLLVLTFAFFLRSALSKPAAVIFPLVPWVIDFYCRRYVNRRMIFEKLPFLAFSVVFGIIAIRAQHEHHLLHNYYPFYQRIAFVGYSLLTYLAKLLAPFHLENIYPYPVMHNGGIPLYFYFATILTGLLVYGVYRTIRYSRLVAFSFLFYLVTIVLELQLISVGDSLMAERYTYVPYIGLLFALAVGVDRLWHNRWANEKMVRLAITVMFVIVSSIFAVSTYARCKT